MAQLTNSTFSKYILTPEEEISGSILNDYQRMFMQNKLCEIAEEKLVLTVDANNYPAYIQKEAELIGQIGILRWLLDVSEETVKLRLEAAKNILS